MTPRLTKWDPEIKSGEVVAVTLQDGIPIAVGIAAFDLGRLSKAVGEKGKAVYLVHCYRDDLWAVGSKKQPPAETSPCQSQHRARGRHSGNIFGLQGGRPALEQCRYSRGFGGDVA